MGNELLEMLQDRVRELEEEAGTKQQQLETAEQQLQEQGEQLRCGWFLRLPGALDVA
jgi:hypothetical protein